MKKFKNCSLCLIRRVILGILMTGFVVGCSSDSNEITDSEKCQVVWEAQAKNMSDYFALQNETGPILNDVSLAGLSASQLETYNILKNEWAEIVLFGSPGCFSENEVLRAKQIKGEG
jgi:hypothetical protein